VRGDLHFSREDEITRQSVRNYHKASRRSVFRKITDKTIFTQTMKLEDIRILRLVSPGGGEEGGGENEGKMRDNEEPRLQIEVAAKRTSASAEGTQGLASKNQLAPSG